jgi:hypothetical protein
LDTGGSPKKFAGLLAKRLAHTVWERPAADSPVGWCLRQLALKRVGSQANHQISGHPLCTL